MSTKNEEDSTTGDGSPVNEEVAEDLAGIESSLPVNEIYDITPINKGRCHLFSKEMYDHMHWRSINDADNFWKEMATEHLRWMHPFDKTKTGSLENGNFSWFTNGKLNVADNCVDRWAELYPDRIAIIWEGDNPQNTKKITYKELLAEVCKFANMLKQLGLKKYDVICIYMPMIPQTVFAMLACARLGMPHSVVFAGFSAISLRGRINDSKCKAIITSDQGLRGGKIIPLKEITDEALVECPTIEHCVVFKHTGNTVNWVEGRDVWGDEMMAKLRPYCPLEIMDSEDTLFMLYTSGSTGLPKGILHTTAGYLLYVALSHKYTFDVHPGDIYACVADVGWITGHSYIVYGPLCNGMTTFLFESIPTYPDAGRYWSMVERHKITQLYTAPTAIRALMKFGDEWPKKYDLSSLRVLATVGEPINPEAWRWFNGVVGGGRCAIVDTFFQTETAGHVLTTFPGCLKTKPGSAGLPFLGIDPVILDSATGRKLEGNSVHGVLCLSQPWPGMMRTVHNNHPLFISTYLSQYPGYYFTGDGAVRDKDGYYWITGRVDDLLNVSGHRIGTAEIEHALVQNKLVAEAAVVGYPHEVKGTGILCYTIVKDAAASKTHDEIIAELKKTVRSNIGPIATPDAIIIVAGLPKTRSGKVMRRVLRKIASNHEDEFGDISTMADGDVIPPIIKSTRKFFGR